MVPTPEFPYFPDKPPKKPFYRNPNHVKTFVTAAVVTGVAYVAIKIKNGDFEDRSISITTTENSLTITKI